MRVGVLIPAHNEQDNIALTLQAVRRQTRSPDLVVVVADGCTDQTASVASELGATVLRTPDNRCRKAGALNFGFVHMRAACDVLVQLDADTEPASDFIQRALDEFARDPFLGGVCARFMAKPGRGLVWRLQRLEYGRYDLWRARKRFVVNVLSGTACVFRMDALRDFERPWDETSLVEDFALTLRLNEAGWTTRAGRHLHALTEVPQSWRALWRQRLRWQRGTFDELRKVGYRPYTRNVIASHVLFAAAIGLRFVWIFALLGCLALGWSIEVSPVWLCFVPLAAAARTYDIRRVPDLAWRDVAMSLLVLPDEGYHIMREMYFIRSWWLHSRKAEWTW